MNPTIKEAVTVLRRGGLILYPTDTVWGLGCDATCPEAVQAVAALKKRDDLKSFIILLSDEAQLDRYVQEVPPIAYQLIEVADTPLTIIYPKGKNLAAGVCAGDGSVGIRIPRHPYCRELLQALGKPLLSTSANISGRPAPVGYADISEEVKAGVDWIAPAETTEPATGKPSSLIQLGPGGQIKILRA